MLTMMPSADERITTAHRAKLAYVYVRQSSPGKVRHHPESTELQYRLVERAVLFAWPTAGSEASRPSKCSGLSSAVTWPGWGGEQQDARTEQRRLLDRVGDEEGREAQPLPDLVEVLLRVPARQRIEGARRARPSAGSRACEGQRGARRRYRESRHDPPFDDALTAPYLADEAPPCSKGATS